jgi:hypothetical protein
MSHRDRFALVVLVVLAFAPPLALGQGGSAPADAKRYYLGRATQGDGAVTAEDRQAINRVLDDYMQSIFGGDAAKHVATFHFPTFRAAGDSISVVARREDLTPESLQRGKPDGWDRTVWVERTIVQSSPEKVHVAAVFRQLRKDGSVIGDFPSLFILDKIGGGWGIRGRSGMVK